MSNLELLKGWKKCNLSYVLSSNLNSIIKNYPYQEIKYLDTGSITNNKIKSFQLFNIKDAPSRAKRLVKHQNIIYSTVRPIQRHFGFIENPQENLVVSTGFSVLDIDKNLASPKFIYYFLSSNEVVEELDAIAEGATSAYPSLKPSDIESLEINLPPLPEQKAIAEVLSSLDDKIDLLHQQNQTLEDMAQTLFREWFIEKADEGWEEVPLSKVANFLNGLACQKFPPKNDVDKLPVLKIKDLKAGISDSSDWASTDVDSKYIIENGDVIFSWSASLVVKIWDGEKCILNQHLFKVTSENYPKWFYYHWCKYHLDRFISISQAHATTMGHIKRKDLDNALCFVPSDNELENMNEKIQPIIEKLGANQKQIKTLEQTRDTLLPKLMSGQVRM